jgi:hypothetical protein
MARASPQPTVHSPTLEPPPSTKDWVSGYVVGDRIEIGTGPKRLPIAGVDDLAVEPADASAANALAALQE